MQAQTKQLFGGALVAAGVVIGASQAAHGDAVYGYGFQPWQVNVATAQTGPFGLPLVYDSDAGYAGVYAQAEYDNFNYPFNKLSNGTAYVDYAYAKVSAFSDYGWFWDAQAYVRLSMYAVYDQQLNITYDFGAPQAYPLGYDYININGSSALDGNNDGMITIQLVAGTVYTLTMRVDALGVGIPGGDSAFVCVQAKAYKAPAPGAVALLGLAALVGRRRRRE